MYIEDICDAAEAMSGIDADSLEGAAAVAEAELLSRLRPGIEVSSVEPQFVAAGALLTLAVHMTAKAADGVASYSAGNMSVSMSGANTKNAASQLRRQAEMLLSGLISDDGFAFLGVDG